MNLPHYPHFIHRVIPIILLVAYLLPFSAHAQLYWDGTIASTSQMTNGSMGGFGSYDVHHLPNWPDTSVQQNCAGGSSWNNNSILQDIIYNSGVTFGQLCYGVVQSVGSTSQAWQVAGNGMYFYAFGSLGKNDWNNLGPTASDTSTRIIQVQPSQGDTVGTTTDLYLEAFINVNHADNHDPLYIHWQLSPNVQPTRVSQCADVICSTLYINKSIYEGNFIIVPDQTATYLVSTSTPIDPDATGQWTMQTAIVRRNTFLGFSGIFGFSFGDTTLVSTTTSFTVGTTTTAQDILARALTGTTYLNATSTAAALSACNPLNGFDILLCIQGLFIPNGGDFMALVNGARTGFLTRFPWGYATRIVDILSSQATSTLPSFTVHIPTAASSSEALTFDEQDMIVGGAATFNSIPVGTTGQTPRQIIEPWIQLFVAISVLIIVFHDIMAMGHHTKHEYR